MEKEIIKAHNRLNDVLYQSEYPKQYKHLTKCRERFNSKYGMYWKFTTLNNYYKLLRTPIIIK